MITLETLPADKGARQKRKRVGRGHGSGHGKTSGRGHNGAGQRTGSKRRLGFEGGQTPIHRRLPKRGFKNPFRVVTEVVNLSALEAKFEDGQRVDAETLVRIRLISGLNVRIKILADGQLSKNLTVQAHAFSAAARKGIEACGGVCEAL